MHSNKYLLVIGGPTASGKTDLAITMARKYTTEIVSADSRQFFREMTIGTAPPSPEQLSSVPHHFIGHRSVHQPYSVGAYERDAWPILQRLFERHDVVILTGGSGLYIQAVCQGLDAFPPIAPEVQQSVQRDYETYGLPFLQEELAREDPDYFLEVDRRNPHRLMRALAVIRQSGQPFSSFRQKKRAIRPFHPIYVALQHERQTLYERINQRVEQMIAQGLEAEARALYPLRHLTALQTVGYQEWFDHFDHRISRQETIDRIKQHTRNFAKRQLTWMRREGFWKHFTPQECPDMLDKYVGWARQKSVQWVWDKATGILQIRSGRAVLASLRLTFTGPSRRPTLQLTDFYRTESDPQAGAWIIHEAVRRGEGQRVLAISSIENEPLFREAGFVNDWQDASASAPHLLFRKIESG